MINRIFALGVLGVLIGVGRAAADEATRFDNDRAQMIARRCTEAEAIASQPASLAITPDIKHAVGFDLKKRAVLAVPTTNLTAAVLAQADQDIVPLGVLYLFRVVPVVVAEPLEANRLRTIEVQPQADKPDVSIVAMPLAVTRIAGRLALLVYANAKEPAVVTTLAETATASDVPLDLEVAPLGENRGNLIVRAFGKYHAAITVAALD